MASRCTDKDKVRGKTKLHAHIGEQRQNKGGWLSRASARATVLRGFVREADDWAADTEENRTRSLEGRLVSVQRTMYWSHGLARSCT